MLDVHVRRCVCDCMHLGEVLHLHIILALGIGRIEASQSKVTWPGGLLQISLCGQVESY